MTVQRYENPPSNGRLQNGEILRGLSIPTPKWPFESDIDFDQEILFPQILHPYVVVVSQECDLYWDYLDRLSGESTGERRNKEIPEILVAEMFNVAELRESANINGGLWKEIKKHQNSRFHYFPPSEPDTNPEVTELAADFKSVFGVDPNLLYSLLKQSRIDRVATLQTDFRRQLNQRLMNWLGRVDLPDDFEIA